MSAGVNKSSRTSAFELGDNDFYWFYFPDTKVHYIIPEFELVASGHIKTPEQEGTQFFVSYPYRHGNSKSPKMWYLNKYRFTLTDDNAATIETEIISLLATGIRT